MKRKQKALEDAIVGPMGFPETIYVRFDDNEQYLMADRTVIGAIDDDGPTVIATYKLVEVERYGKEVKKL